MRAISVFSLEAGTSTLGWRAWIALRTRVSMSAMGSLVIVLLLYLPSALSAIAELPDLRISYQLALTTPGISPLSASWRKHRRQMPNLRRKARGRPQRQQRLRWRVGSIAIPGLPADLATWDSLRILPNLMSLAILAVVAI